MTAGLIALLLALAVCNSFVQDDAFISYRYASNLIEGNGLVWNPGGERVEGYTNFLWTLLIAGGMRLGMDPVAASKLFGLAFFGGTLWMTARLSRQAGLSGPFSLLCLLLLGTNYSFSAYATGGLETQMQTFFLTAAVSVVFRLTAADETSENHQLLLLSLLGTAALMTRLDSVVFLAVPGLYLLFHCGGDGAPACRQLHRAGRLVLPALLLVGAWFLWKVLYYGDWLPNTFYAKMDGVSADVIHSGWAYVSAFVRSYLLLPMLLAVLLVGRPLLRRAQTRCLVLLVLLWTAYVIRVGGDFMEFRFLVPVLPVLFILFAAALAELPGRLVRCLLAVLVLAGSLSHALVFDGQRGLESVAGLQGHLLDRKAQWIEVGQILKERFGEAEDPVRIATLAAGAIPFYSELPTVDMLGLNDREVARNGLLSKRFVPGHRRFASMQYLLERGVNLVLGHPLVCSAGFSPRGHFSVEQLKLFFIPDPRRDLLPPSARVLEIPVDPEHKIIVLYLLPNATVDQLIFAQDLKTYEIK